MAELETCFEVAVRFASRIGAEGFKEFVEDAGFHGVELREVAE